MLGVVFVPTFEESEEGYAWCGSFFISVNFRHVN